MAAAFLGGSFLSAFLQVLFNRMASCEFLDLFKGQKFNDRLLKQLKSTMRAVNKVLKDAEGKQITGSDVKDWLDEHKDAVYEADDLLDEITQCDQLVASLPRGSSILEIRLGNLLASRFMRLKKLPSGLQRLEVRQWDSLDSALKRIEQMDVVFTALEEISIFSCGFESLCAHEKCLGNFTSLRLLEIDWCLNLKRLPERLSFLLPSLAALHIYDCPGIESIPEGGFLLTLESTREMRKEILWKDD